MFANESFIVFGVLFFFVHVVSFFGRVFAALNQKRSWKEKREVLIDTAAGLAFGIVAAVALRLLASKAAQVVVITIVGLLYRISLHAAPVA